MPEHRLGDLLISAGLLTPGQLSEGLSHQAEHGGLLGATLVELGHIREEDLADALAVQEGYDRGLPNGDLLRSDVLMFLDEDFINRHGVVPLLRTGDLVVVGTADPTNVAALDATRRALAPLELRLTVLTPTEFEGVLSTRANLLDAEAEALRLGPTARDEEMRVSDGSSPAARIVDSLLHRAVQQRASDIHIEPTNEDSRVRMRVDGIMTDVTHLPRGAHPMVVSRVKILGEMDIANRHTPQDGHCRIRHDGRAVDLRISVLPVVGGEMVVIRILDGQSTALSLDTMGFSPDLLASLRALLDRPQGIIIVTGPTGSGKSTTLYGALDYLMTKGNNITTIEDPVEQNIDGLNQAQVNPKQGLTFASGLRAILRQDPDVIMVGETRDLETAEVAFRAALTGHLVLTTVHTNDAATAVTRLVDLGLEPYMVASSLIGVLAQRLVRRVCGACAIRAPLDPGDHLRLRLFSDRAEVPATEMRGGSVPDCPTCAGRGLQGRTVVAELLEVDANIAHLITAGATDRELESTAAQAGMRTMQEAGLDLIRDGITTAAEILRVLPPRHHAGRPLRRAA